jgi:hypothetical protein
VTLELEPLVDDGGLTTVHTARAQIVADTAAGEARTYLLRRLNESLPAGAQSAHVDVDAVTIVFDPNALAIATLRR